MRTWPALSCCLGDVYDCQWGTDTIRVIVAGELPREAHNAPLHLFSASAELVEFGRRACRRRSESTSALLGQLFARFRAEGLAMTYTIEDFQRQYAKEHFRDLTPQERREALVENTCQRHSFVPISPWLPPRCSWIALTARGIVTNGVNAP